MTKMESLELRNGDSINVYFCQDDRPRVITTYALPNGKEYTISTLVTDERFGDPDVLEIHVYGDPDDPDCTDEIAISRESMRENAYD